LKKELIIPIYVDTNALLDLLASIEDGFSMVEKVTSRETHGRSTDHSVEGGGGTEFGIPNVLSLLKIKLSGSTNSRNSQEKTAETQAERFHIYGSLLTRLRAHLNDNELVVRVDGGLDEWLI